jgi:hypothetical protein
MVGVERSHDDISPQPETVGRLLFLVRRTDSPTLTEKAPPPLFVRPPSTPPLCKYNHYCLCPVIIIILFVHPLSPQLLYTVVRWSSGKLDECWGEGSDRWCATIEITFTSGVPFICGDGAVPQSFATRNNNLHIMSGYWYIVDADVLEIWQLHSSVTVKSSSQAASRNSI